MRRVKLQAKWCSLRHLQRRWALLVVLACAGSLPAQSAVDSVVPAIERGDLQVALHILEPLAARGDKWAYRNLGVVYSRFAEMAAGSKATEHYIKSFSHFRAAELLGDTEVVGDRTDAARMLSPSDLKRGALQVASLLGRHEQSALAASDVAAVSAVAPRVSASSTPTAAPARPATVSEPAPQKSAPPAAATRGAALPANSDDANVRHQLEMMSLSSTLEADRIRILTNIAARGARNTDDLGEALADELSVLKRRAEFAAGLRTFDRLAQATAVREQVSSTYDKLTGNLTIVERVYLPPGNDVERADRSVLVNQRVVVALLWALGATGDPAAADLLQEVPEELVFLPPSLLRDAITRAKSRKTIAPVPVPSSGRTRWTMEQQAQLLIAASSTFDDRLTLSNSLVRTPQGRQTLLRLLTDGAAPEVENRTTEWLQRLAMLDPEASQRQTAVLQLANEIGFAVCGVLKYSNDVSLLPKLEATLRQLKASNPQATFTRSIEGLVIALRARK